MCKVKKENKLIHLVPPQKIVGVAPLVIYPIHASSSAMQIHQGVEPTQLTGSVIYKVWFMCKDGQVGMEHLRLFGKRTEGFSVFSKNVCPPLIL